jgi:hypothetical protein
MPRKQIAGLIARFLEVTLSRSVFEQSLKYMGTADLTDKSATHGKAREIGGNDWLGIFCPRDKIEINFKSFGLGGHISNNLSAPTPRNMQCLGTGYSIRPEISAIKWPNKGRNENCQDAADQVHWNADT